MPSTKKVGGPGTRLDIPVTHINASYVRSHFDAIEVGLPDAPKANEMVVALVMTDGGPGPCPGRRPRGAGRQGGGRSEMKAKIRKIVTVVDETLTEQGREVSPPVRRAAAVAVIANPFAGRFEEDLSELIDIGEELGGLLAARAVEALGIEGSQVESYGKAAAVGEDGELEHAAAILHPKLGAPFRKVLGKGAALIPSSKKAGGMGVVLDIPWATRTRPSSAATSMAWRCG